MIKNILKTLTLGVFVASMAMVGCGDKKEETITLKLGHIQSEQDLWQAGSIKFKEEVERLSKGSIKVEVYPNSTLGGDRDLAEGMQMGTVDFALIAGVLGNFDKSISILELPYLFRNHDEYVKIVDGPIGQEIADNVLKNSGIKLLAFWDRGPRHVTANREIRTPADLNGLKIRVPEIPAMVDTWKAMGATPTPMAWSEVYTGLQQKIIDAQENPIPFIYGGRIQEVQKYLIRTAHKYEYVTLAMSDKKIKQLSKEQMDIITQAAKTATDYENSLVLSETDKLLNEMVSKNGLEVIDLDTAPFVELAIPAHAPYAQSIGQTELLNRINSELGH